MPKRGDSADFALNETEVNGLWAKCHELIDKVLIGLLIFCGLRVSEAVHLNSSWLKEGEIHIPARMPCKCWECGKRKVEPGYWKPKTKAGVRVIPVPSVFLPYLEQYLHYAPDGLPFNRTTAWNRVQRLAREAKIARVFPHSLRATCATIIASTPGITVPALCYIMGWTDLRVAERYIKIAQARKLVPKIMKDAFG